MSGRGVFPRHRTLGQIFTVPLLIGVMSLVGLVAALVGDGIWDALSWLMLATPIVIYIVCVYIPRRSRAR
ncbi:putative protein OS=Afipia felis OX=1035 GN=NCTC12722_02564 PE=4 SV=1 [Afipia felis]